MALKLYDVVRKTSSYWHGELGETDEDVESGRLYDIEVCTKTIPDCRESLRGIGQCRNSGRKLNEDYD